MIPYQSRLVLTSDDVGKHWLTDLRTFETKQVPNFSGFPELVFSSSHLVAKGVLTAPDHLHISYVNISKYT